MKLIRLAGTMALIVCAIAAGCLQTQSEVAVKPVDINLNITGRLDVVITDARQQEEKVTGTAPKRAVRPEDIGLPAAPAPGAPAPGAMLMDDGPSLPRFELVSEIVTVADGDDQRAQLIQRRAARDERVEALLASHLVGESHTGLLVAKGSLSGSQRALITEENADRKKLFSLEAAEKNTGADQAALAHYMARLEHVDKGTWVERYDKSTGSWEWFQWDK